MNVIPLRFGSGMKVKTINGLCRGIPIVTTTIGAEALKVTHGEDIFIDDTHAGFIKYITLLLTDKNVWEKLQTIPNKPHLQIIPGIVYTKF